MEQRRQHRQSSRKPAPRLLRNATLHADGKLAEKLAGTPQGSPASPVVANICLHVLLDTWFAKDWADKGEFVRYADDALFVFTDEDDARAFQQALGARLIEAGLKLNLDKTRIVPFSASAPKGTITLLGFELYWGQHFGKGKRLKVKTIPKRLARAAQNFKDRIKARRSQKRSYTWEQFLRRLRFSPLPRPPRGPGLIEISSEHVAVRKHKPKSRMPKSGTYGSVRSASRKLVFT